MSLCTLFALAFKLHLTLRIHSSVVRLYSILDMYVQTGGFFALTLHLTQHIHSPWHCTMALFNISYACEDRISPPCTHFALTLHLIHGIWCCKMALFDLSYACQDWISPCTQFGFTLIECIHG